MASKAKEPEAPLSASQRIVKERRAAALAQAKEQKKADVSLFDLSVVLVPPDPEKEEPVPDEPLSEEDKEIERAFLESAGPPLPEDVAAVEAMAGADEELSVAEELAAAEPLCTCRPSEGYGGALVIFGCPVHDIQGREIDAEEEPLGPESFGGSDEESHFMAQTSAAKLREEMQGREEEALGLEKTSEALTSASDVASVAPGASSPQPSSGFALFGRNMFGDEVKAKPTGPLAQRFKLPPFTVLDARQGIWQDRKRAWLSLGIQSEVGRGENLLNMSDTVLEPDPVKRAEMIKQREKKNKTSAFGQEFILGAQPGVDGKPGGQGKAWHTNDTGISRKLAPGGGGGGAWIGGPKTASSDKYGREGEAEVVLDENGQPLASKTGTSIFDPVLTELIYSWFVPPSGLILDPFAGGSVRGIVAAKLKRIYVGIELRGEQIAANEKQAEKICVEGDTRPLWIEGDSTNAKELTDGGSFDFIMACPPYADLEQYSDDPRDLSNMEYVDFAKAYEAIIAAALDLLKPDRFACFVVGDIRDEKGLYRGLPELTVRCFEEHGGRKYNEAVLVTSVGSLPIRINKQFGKGRKLGKTHQNVLVFVKGDPFRAAEACGGQQEFSL